MEENSEKKGYDGKKSEDEDIYWPGCIITLVVVIGALWGLIHFNPSEQEHREAINEVVQEAKMDNYHLDKSSRRALRDAKYHSLGIVSWTSTRYHGRTHLITIGAVGYVHSFLDY